MTACIFMAPVVGCNGATERFAGVEDAEAERMGVKCRHQPKGGDALRLGSKGRYGSCVGGR